MLHPVSAKLAFALMILAVGHVAADDGFFRQQLPSMVILGESNTENPPSGGTDSPDPLAVTQTGTPSGTLDIGQQVSAAFIATGGTGGYTYSILTSDLSGPGNAGDLALSNTGQLTGTLINHGSYSFVVRTSSGAENVDRPLSFSVRPSVGTLQVLSAPAESIEAGSAYAAQIQYSGIAAFGSFDAFTIGDLSASAAGDTLSIAGTAPATPGLFSYQVSATDFYGRPISVPVSHTVIAPIAVAYTSISGYPGASYPAPTVTGATAPLTFSTSIPSGLASIDPSTGAITLAQGLTTASTGTYTVTVTDANSRQKVASVPVSVTMPPLPAFSNLTAQVAGQTVQSSIQQVQGAGTIATSIVGGQFRVCSDAACSSPLRIYGTGNYDVPAGSYVQLSTTAPATAGDTATATLTVGGRPVVWTATTFAPTAGVSEALNVLATWQSQMRAGQTTAFHTPMLASPPSGFTNVGGELRHPWNARAVGVYTSSPQGLQAVYDKVPSQACKEMIAFSGGNGVAGTKIRQVMVFNSVGNNITPGGAMTSITQAQADSLCSDTVQNIVWFYNKL